MQKYLNLVDWKGLELSSSEIMCKASVKKFECSPTAWAEWIEMKETLATFIPPEDHRDTEKVVLDSQADSEVLKWSTDFPGDEIDREDGSGLEFECQLNTPSLARLHHFRKLGGTNVIALRKTLLDKQDLLQMDAGGFLDEGYHTTRGGWWVRARAEECSRLCIQCKRA